MQGRIRGNEYRTTVVCIDSYENGVPAGRFFNPYHQEGEQFYGLVQFLVRMEDTLDAMDFPQSFTAVRAFAPAPVSVSPVRPPELSAMEGKLATFSVRVLFRQNASWQGSVTWLDGGRSQSFRSVLELILLMDSALRSGSSAAETAD